MGPQWTSALGVAFVFFLSERQNIMKTAEVTDVQAETLLQTRCSKCHNLERAFAKRRTDHEWKILVKRMSNRHRGWIDDAEADLIGSYLAKIYGIKEQAVKIQAGATVAGKSSAMVQPAVKRVIDFAPLFKANGCVFCHGEDGAGVAPGTPDWTDPEWQGSKTDEGLSNSITNGVDKRMPKFKGTLQEDEIAAAVKFVRSLR